MSYPKGNFVKLKLKRKKYINLFLLLVLLLRFWFYIASSCVIYESFLDVILLQGGGVPT